MAYVTLLSMVVVPWLGISGALWLLATKLFGLSGWAVPAFCTVLAAAVVVLLLWLMFRNSSWQ